ncbi:MAG: hypothetical protein P9M13_03965 [Candidatus Ancaeobacter aquaticus]|nr:hypothetical protein [Candidatus Ancaeobacter aquaticus]
MRIFRYIKKLYVLFLSFGVLLSTCSGIMAEEEQQVLLPSWNDGPTKSTILEYIKKVTAPDGDSFIEEKDRIAVFRDNGVLICEKPEIAKAFVVRAVKRVGKKQPEILSDHNIKDIFDNGIDAAEKLNAEEIKNIDALINEKAGEEAYRDLVRDFITTGKNAHFDRLYKDLLYQPMRGLVSYVRALGFDVFIVTSEDTHFVKNISGDLYGVQPENVFDYESFKAQSQKQPVIAVGRINNGGDIDVLKNSKTNTHPSLQMVVKHDDQKREYVYGQNDQATLSAAKENGWTVISIKNDWENVFSAEENEEKQTSVPLAVKGSLAEQPSDGGLVQVETDKTTPTPVTGITRPLSEKGPTKVAVGFYVLDIDEINTIKQSFAANIFIALQWWDPRLAHSGKGTVTYDVNDVWNPKPLLLNRQRLWKSFPEVVQVSSSGEVNYRQRSWGYFSQPLDLRDFPFDEQTLNFTFVIAGVSPQEVEFSKSEVLGFGKAEHFSVPDWDVVGWDCQTKPWSPIKGRELSTITFSLILKRHSEHYIYKIVIPLIFIVIMSWIVFWIDPKEVATNVASATTCFLTLIAYRFMISTYLPEIPYFTRLDALVFGGTILVFTSLIQTIAMSYLFRKGKEKIARNIERVARVVYPVIFIIVIIFTMVI